MLAVNQVSFAREEIFLFSKVSFNLAAGQLLQIVGANGVGKTTLLRILCGLIPPTTGEIYWQNQTITQSTTDYLPQVSYLAHQAGSKTGLTVRENLLMAKALTTGTEYLSLEAALETVGLAQLASAITGTLSAGQLRRLLFAKLLLRKTKLWILDEPFAALDSAGVQLGETLLSQHVQQGGMVVLTSHQPFALSAVTQQRLELCSRSSQ